MDLLTAILGLATLLLGLVLGAITLSSRILKGLKANVREVLFEEGIIRPGPIEARWPNGWHTLPDTLNGIWEKQRQMETEIEDAFKKLS